MVDLVILFFLLKCLVFDLVQILVMGECVRFLWLVNMLILALNLPDCLYFAKAVLLQGLASELHVHIFRHGGEKYFGRASEYIIWRNRNS